MNRTNLLKFAYLMYARRPTGAWILGVPRWACRSLALQTSIIAILFVFLSVCAAVAPALSGESTCPLQVFPADHTVRIDPETKAVLTFLTTQTPSSAIYFHERSWLADSSMIIFRGDHGLMGYLVATGELVDIRTSRGRVGGATAAARRNSIFCMRGNDVLELGLTIEVSPDTSAAASRVLLAERTIATLRSAGQLNGNYDDHYLAIGLGGDAPSIAVIDVADGSVREVCKIEPPLERCTHVQWSRSQSNLLSFAGGADWHRPGALDRIWMVDPAEGIPRPAHHQVDGELVTHESWWVE